MNKLRSTLESFIATLHTYDYILFGISGALFLLILLLAIVLRKKVGLSLFLVLLSFIIIIAGPTLGYQYIHATLYKTELTDLTIKRLEFSEAVVIKGTLTNLGKQSFNRCKISAKAYRGADNFLEELVLPLKPFQKMSILKEEKIDINNSIDFKMILEPFTYSKEYNISINVDCL